MVQSKRKCWSRNRVYEEGRAEDEELTHRSTTSWREVLFSVNQSYF